MQQGRTGERDDGGGRSVETRKKWRLMQERMVRSWEMQSQRGMEHKYAIKCVHKQKISPQLFLLKMK